MGRLKLLCLGILLTVTISSTPVFAETGVNSASQTTTKQTVAKQEIFNPYPEKQIKVRKTTTVKESSVTRSASVQVAQTTILYTDGTLAVQSNTGTWYSCNTATDYVGYNHITTGQAVYCAQLLLNTTYNPASLGVDGLFGSLTRTAVQNFQTLYGLSCDGIIGLDTWSHLVAAQN